MSTEKVQHEYGVVYLTYPALDSQEGIQLLCFEM